jgi:hypothetical protein
MGSLKAVLVEVPEIVNPTFENDVVQFSDNLAWSNKFPHGIHPPGVIEGYPKQENGPNDKNLDSRE